MKFYQTNRNKTS